MTDKKHKPLILWVLQENQTTDHIVEFLTRLKAGISKLDIMFAVPEKDQAKLTHLAPLSPHYFKVYRKDHGNTQKNYQHKKDLIRQAKYSGELEAWKTLLLDDLWAGTIIDTTIAMEPLHNLRGIILQIPVPLGSTTDEEHIFEAWVKWAHRAGVFVTGYELLPLYTRWKLLPSALDAIITTNRLSCTYLSETCEDIPGHVWQLPRYEASVFSLGAGSMWKKGLELPYYLRMNFKISHGVAIIYIPHNVAMSYEYGRLIRAIEKLGSQLHLMFSISEDQTRGTHTQKDIIEITCGDALSHFHSVSFHDQDAPWEMVAADAVLSCAHNHVTMIGNTLGIPGLVWDESVPEAKSGNLEIIRGRDTVIDRISNVISRRHQKTDIIDILFQIANQEHPKIKAKQD